MRAQDAVGLEDLDARLSTPVDAASSSTDMCSPVAARRKSSSGATAATGLGAASSSAAARQPFLDHLDGQVFVPLHPKDRRETPTSLS
jgi:hypothetical protein